MKKITAYEAEDGTLYKTKDECESHNTESELMRRLAEIWTDDVDIEGVVGVVMKNFVITRRQ